MYQVGVFVRLISAGVPENIAHEVAAAADTDAPAGGDEATKPLVDELTVWKLAYELVAGDITLDDLYRQIWGVNMADYFATKSPKV